MVNEETQKALNKVCNRIASKYYLPGYEKEDIYQEAYVIGLEILDKYDPERNPKVENFLTVSINNRFQNFIRLKSENKKNCGCLEYESCKKCRYREAKAKVIHTQQFTENFDYTDSIVVYRERLKEILPIIDLRLPVSMRDDWRRILDDSHVVRSRKQEILDEIREIVKEYEEEIEISRKNPTIEYEYGWDIEEDKDTNQIVHYFFIETKDHLVKIYTDEESSVIWLSNLSGLARQAYLKLKEAIIIDKDEVNALGESINKLEMWNV